LTRILFYESQAGREGREKFGKWKKERGRAGSTKKEKRKIKVFKCSNQIKTKTKEIVS
jgi:hypothetical protein